VEKQGEADPLPVSAALVFILPVLPFKIAHGVEFFKHLVELYIVRKAAVCRGRVAGVHPIPRLKNSRVEAQPFGDMLHVHLHAENHLRGAEAPESSVRHGVGPHDVALHPERGHFIGADGRDHGALHHDGGQPVVGPRVEADIHVDGQDVPFFVHRSSVFQCARMALRRDGHVLPAVQDQADRLFHLHGRDRREAAHDGRIVFLPPKAPPMVA
jgi:hypothetical protein